MKNLVLVFTLTLLIPVPSLAQGSAFNFQGRLNDGTNPANGRYDLQFRLYDSIVGGNPLGPVVFRPNTILINGVFSITLEFGATPFANPNSVFIEIGVRPSGSPNAYTILGPRQQLTVVPFALQSANATNADHATNATTAATATTATTATMADDSVKLAGLPSTRYAKLDSTNNAGSLDIDGHITSGGYLEVNGNATQNFSSYGLAKAMVEVTYNAQGMPISHCFNGVTHSTAENCGFVLTMPLEGVIRIDFGFAVSNRFIALAVEYTPNGVNNNAGANYRRFGNTAIEVFTFAATSEDTHRKDFNIILY